MHEIESYASIVATAHPRGLLPKPRSMHSYARVDRTALESPDPLAEPRHVPTQVPALRHAEPARRPAAGSAVRRARHADLSDDFVRLQGRRPGGVTLQHGARETCLLAHLESDERGARGADRRARRRRRRDRRGERAGSDASGDRHAYGRGLAHRRESLAVWQLSQPPRIYPPPLWR